MKVLVIGLGSIAQKHIAALRKINPEVVIYALRHSSNSEAFEGIINTYNRSEVVSLNVDFAIVSNPTSEHFSTLEWLAKLNIPLFIEKPIFDKIVELPKIDSLTYVACNLRFIECLQWVKMNIGSKTVNEVNCYCGSYLPTWRSSGDWRKVYSANKEMGGGVHIDIIHEIDYLYWLFGKPNEVFKIFRNNSSLNISAVDYANYTMIYDNFAVSVVLNYYRRDYKRTLEIVFDDSTWLIDMAQNNVVDSTNGNLLFSSKQTMVDTYLEQMKYFTTLVESSKKDSMNSAHTALDVLKICLKDETC